MHSDLVELGFTEDHWNRIVNTVTQEAQKARVAAQALPLVGPEDASTVAIPNYTLGEDDNPSKFKTAHQQPEKRLTADSDPRLYITTIAVNVQLRAHEMADPELQAALTMFRRAANYVARIEDALVFNGRPGPHQPPAGLNGVPPVFTVTGNDQQDGLVGAAAPLPKFERSGEKLFRAVIDAINKLEEGGQLGPFAALLSHDLFALACDPTSSLVLPRDRILPFLQGPLLRSSQIPNGTGCVVALSGSPIELVVACDVAVRYLQTTLEPRYVFRVSERVALRIKEKKAIVRLEAT